MKATDKKVTWEGTIDIYEQEGGCVESSLTIDEMYPVAEIENAFEETVERTLAAGRLSLPGRWRLTLERIE